MRLSLCIRLNGDLQNDMFTSESPEPMHIASFGKEVFVDTVK